MYEICFRLFQTADHISQRPLPQTPGISRTSLSFPDIFFRNNAKSYTPVLLHGSHEARIPGNTMDFSIQADLPCNQHACSSRLPDAGSRPPISTAAATGRSNPAPSFFISAGAKFTVTRFRRQAEPVVAEMQSELAPVPPLPEQTETPPW